MIYISDHYRQFIPDVLQRIMAVETGRETPPTPMGRSRTRLPWHMRAAIERCLEWSRELTAAWKAAGSPRFRMGSASLARRTIDVRAEMRRQSNLSYFLQAGYDYREARRRAQLKGMSDTAFITAARY